MWTSGQASDEITGGGAAVSVTLTNARAGVLARMQEIGRPVTVGELADALGQHRNTVRNHVEALREAGMLSVEVCSPLGRGRPAMRYSLQNPNLPTETEYVTLAKVLSYHIVEQIQPTSVEAMSATWAQLLTQRMRDSDKPVTEPVEMLREMGFDPDTDVAGEVILRRCPLAKLSPQQSEHLCEMHRETVIRVLEGAGVDVSSHSLRTRPLGGNCLVYTG